MKIGDYCGRQLFIDMYKCESDITFKNKLSIMTRLHKIIVDAGATIIHTHSHNFEGGGLSGLFILSESHLSIHTWPEFGYVSIDVYMCGDCDPNDTRAPIVELFNPFYTKFQSFDRGSLDLIKELQETE